MMRHVLVAKGLWNIVQGDNVRPIVVASTTRTGTSTGSTSTGDAGAVEDAIGSTSIAAPIYAPRSIVEQLCWNGRDAQAHALLALSVKHAIIPHIRSCRTLKEA